MSYTLPAGFESLEPFLQKWALPTQNERQLTRLNASTAELKAFYDGILPLMPAALEYVDKFNLGEIPDDGKPLYWMMLSMAEIAPHVELYRGDPKVPHSFDERRFIAEHGGLSE
jgi:hypothetical protein